MRERHWTRTERDRWRELTKQRLPWIRFAPSTEEMARRFGHLSKR